MDTARAKCLFRRILSTYGDGSRCFISLFCLTRPGDCLIDVMQADCIVYFPCIGKTCTHKISPPTAHPHQWYRNLFILSSAGSFVSNQPVISHRHDM